MAIDLAQIKELAAAKPAKLARKSGGSEKGENGKGKGKGTDGN